MLAACLESCRDAVSEMVIVDTGSSDRTVEIAESFGARVVHFAWTGSFAEARNVGIDAATGDWILWLDADEQLEPGDDARLAELTRQPWREAHWLVETNYTGQQEAGTASQHLALRLWRNRAHYRFSGAIHEQIRNSMAYDLTERFGPPTLASATTATSRRASTSATSTSATSSCCRASSRRTRGRRSRTSTSAPSTSAWTTCSRRGGTTSRGSRCCATSTPGGSSATRRSSSRASAACAA